MAHRRKRLRKCFYCGYINFHPLIWCNKCGGRMREIEVSWDEYWDLHKKRYYSQEDIEDYRRLGYDIDKMYENIKKTGEPGDYTVPK